MAIKLIPVTEDQNCPFCGTLVKAGTSVCTGCQAEHGIHDDQMGRKFLLGILIIMAIIGTLNYLNLYPIVGLIFGCISGTGIYFLYKHIKKEGTPSFWR